MTRRKGARRRRGNGGRLAGVLVVLVMALYIPAMWKWFFTKGIESGIIQEAVLELKTPVTGLFVRDEKLLAAPDSGMILPVARYGEKVPLGGEIASFLAGGSQDMYAQYDNARQEVLRRVAAAAREAGNADMLAMAAAVDQESSGLPAAANNGDLTAVARIRDHVDRLLADQATSLVNSSKAAGYLEEEKQELQKLKTRMGKALEPVRAEMPGIICYRFDGFENVLTPDIVPSLTAGSIALHPDAAVEATAWVTPEQIPVKASDPYAKLVQNDACWLVFTVDAAHGRTLSSRYESARLAQEESRIEMEVQGVDGRLDMRLDSVIQSADGKGETLVVGRINRRVEQTMELRKVTGNLVIRRLEGMKVPRKALFNRNTVDGTADIMLRKMNKASVRRIRILGEQDAWAIIDNLDNAVANQRVSVYDQYLQDPDGLLDGQVLPR